ncbi:MAG: uridine kinase [Longimicrobiales bacterium]
MSIILGVAGGSGSGKTTVVKSIVKSLGKGQVTVVHHDSYYRDAAHLSPAERQAVNYDHPDALDTDLLVDHLSALRNGQPAAIPTYDFTTHSRLAETETAEPRKVIILDGLLILWDERLRRLMDIKVFVDTDADIRFIRRLSRDIEQRGRTAEWVIKQYLDTVRLMHLEFVEPSKRYADLIMPEGGRNHVAVDMLLTKIRSVLREGGSDKP